jgi:hypothetical protein
MFGDSDRDRDATMGKMLSEAMDASCANRLVAKEKVVEMIKNDRRFDHYDHSKLVDEVMQKGQYGGRMDWNDPSLKRGGQNRPQSFGGGRGRMGAI